MRFRSIRYTSQMTNEMNYETKTMIIDIEMQIPLESRVGKPMQGCYEGNVVSWRGIERRRRVRLGVVLPKT